MPKTKSYYDKVYDITRLIPRGQVASYGQIADYIDGCTPRMVGYALFALRGETDVPWQRVVNASGGISPRPGSDRQRARLETEGILFSAVGKIDLKRFGWPGPEPSWLAKNGLLP
ncbi:MGMT family protein [Govanella unica]|uniref:MGMT family protein n=1 Tax=Govanella unica TaxID=2975056 RepID=A0A9X3TW27_9PROT|nr:MGMT family protein [Govania unica]